MDQPQGGGQAGPAVPDHRPGDAAPARPAARRVPPLTAAPDTAPILTVAGLTKRFGRFAAVDGADLAARPGELLALLGPSGCGKTTLLRMVAGLERPSAGEIVFDGRTFASVPRAIYLPPEKRNVGMVFQSYALWPHMTVAENVGYPLRIRGLKAAEVRSRVAAALALIGLGDLAARTIPQLSGGQQQRVALARALVYEPALMLFDEPFSNLDAQIRNQMRLELKALRRKVRMTGLFVTHDQVEALSVADRVAIMREGRIVQVGTPTEVYRRPASRFVRDFLGRVVTLHGTVAGRDGDGVAVRLDGAGATVITAAHAAAEAGARVELSLRPEQVRLLAAPGATPNAVAGEVVELLFTGACYEAQIRIGGALVALDLPPDRPWREGAPVALALPADAIALWRDGAA